MLHGKTRHCIECDVVCDIHCCGRNVIDWQMDPNFTASQDGTGNPLKKHKGKSALFIISLIFPCFISVREQTPLATVLLTELYYYMERRQGQIPCPRRKRHNVAVYQAISIMQRHTSIRIRIFCNKTRTHTHAQQTNTHVTTLIKM